MFTFKRFKTSLSRTLVTISLLAGLLPLPGAVRAQHPESTPTPTRAPFAYGVSFLAPDGSVGTTYRGRPDTVETLPTADPTELPAKALTHINDARQTAALPPLQFSEALTEAAREHATDLMSSGVFQHRGSDGHWPADRAARHGHPTTHLGENLAVGYVNPQAAVDAWLADDGCRANLLDPRLTYAGLAFAHNGLWHNYWVLILGDLVQPTAADDQGEPGGDDDQNFSIFIPLVTKAYEGLMLLPDDPSFDSQWGLHNPGQGGGTNDADIDAPQAWTYHTGDSSVIVAIVDTGVDLDHPEFNGHLVDGKHYYHIWNGKTWIPQEDENVEDDNGHGTHVTGIAAAAGNNGIGVAGVAWGVRIMPVKALDSEGIGIISDIATGVRYAADNGAKVVNLSLGGESDSSTMRDAVDYAYSKGVLIVAAAGNDGDNVTIYPAGNEHVLGVGSTDWNDARSYFSNYGRHVDIAAPGSSILSTYRGGGYVYKDGTSMATPFVAGLAGLIYSKYPSYTPDQVARAIVHNADDLGSSGRDDYFGCGRINARRSLSNGALSNGCAGWGGLSVQGVQAQPSPLADAEFRPGVLLIKFKDIASLDEREGVLSSRGLTTVKVIKGLGIRLIAVPEGQELALAEALNADPAVAYAEPDYTVYALPLLPEAQTTALGETIH